MFILATANINDIYDINDINKFNLIINPPTSRMKISQLTE